MMMRLVLVLTLAAVAGFAWMDREPPEPPVDEAALAGVSARQKELLAKLARPVMFQTEGRTIREAIEDLARQEQTKVEFRLDQGTLAVLIGETDWGLDRPALFRTFVPMPMESILAHLVEPHLLTAVPQDGVLWITPGLFTQLAMDEQDPLRNLVPGGFGPRLQPFQLSEAFPLKVHGNLFFKADRAAEARLAMSLHELDGPVLVDESPALRQSRQAAKDKLQRPATLDLVGATLDDVSRELSVQIGLNVFFETNRRKDRITICVRRVPAAHILTALLREDGYEFRNDAVTPRRVMRRGNVFADQTIAYPAAAAMKRVAPPQPLEAFSANQLCSHDFAYPRELDRRMLQPMRFAEGILENTWTCEPQIAIYQDYLTSLPFAPPRARVVAESPTDLTAALAQPSGVDGPSMPLEEALARIARARQLNLIFYDAPRKDEPSGALEARARTPVPLDGSLSVQEQIRRFGKLGPQTYQEIVLVSRLLQAFEAYPPAYIGLRNLEDPDGDPFFIDLYGFLSATDCSPSAASERVDAGRYETTIETASEILCGRGYLKLFGDRGAESIRQCFDPRGEAARILQPWFLLDPRERAPVLLKALEDPDPKVVLLAAWQIAHYVPKKTPLAVSPPASSEPAITGRFWPWPLGTAPSRALMRALLRMAAREDAPPGVQMALWGAIRAWPLSKEGDQEALESWAVSERERALALCRLLESPVEISVPPVPQDLAARLLKARGEASVQALVEELLEAHAGNTAMSSRARLARLALENVAFDSDAVAKLEPMFFDPRPELHRYAFQILAKSPTGSPSWGESIDRWLKHKDPAIRARTCDLVHALDQAVLRDRQRLRSVAEQDSDDKVRAAARRALESATEFTDGPK